MAVLDEGIRQLGPDILAQLQRMVKIKPSCDVCGRCDRDPVILATIKTLLLNCFGYGPKAEITVHHDVGSLCAFMTDDEVLQIDAIMKAAKARQRAVPQPAAEDDVIDVDVEAIE